MKNEDLTPLLFPSKEKKAAYGRREHFEYRILTKEKTNGMFEMVSYNFKIVSGAPQKSSVTRVPEISKSQLEDIIQNVVRKTNTGPDEYGCQSLNCEL